MKNNTNRIKPISAETINNKDLHVVMFDEENALWHTTLINGQWSALGNLKSHTGYPGSGVIVGLSLSATGEELQVVMVRADSSLWHCIRHANGTWTKFSNLKEQTGEPGTSGTIVGITSSASGNEMQLCVAKSDGCLWHCTRHADGKWTKFDNVEEETGEPGTSGTIVGLTSSASGNEMQLVVAKSDGSLWHCTRHANGDWTKFGNLKEQTGEPETSGTIVGITSSASGNEMQLCVAKSDGGLWHCIRHAKGDWTKFGNISEQVGDHGKSRIAAMGSTIMEGNLHLFITKASGCLLRCIRDEKGNWEDFRHTSFLETSAIQMMNLMSSVARDLSRQFLRINENSGKPPHTKAYLDHKGIATISTGLNLHRGDAKDIIGLIAPKADFDQIKSAKEELTYDQALAIEDHILNEAENIAKRKLGDEHFNKLNSSQKTSIISLTVNSPSLLGPNLTKFIKSGEMVKAADEIQYRSNKNNHSGIQNRRNREAEFFRVNVPAPDTGYVEEPLLQA